MAQDDSITHDPTAAPRASERTSQIAEVLALLDDVLGADLVGAYLHGSATLGGLRPHSDLDILAVSRRPTTRAEKERLVGRLLAISSVERFDVASGAATPEMRRPIELTIVVQAQVRPWRFPPSFDFQYGDWWRREFERGDVEPWPTSTNPDLASLITMVLLVNRSLTGPPPAEVLDPVPRAAYVRAIVGDVDKLLGDLAWDTRNVLLTLARVWSTVATDYIRSKDAAATWALAHLPSEHQPVLTRARAGYLGQEEDRWDDITSHVRPCVDYMIGEIKRIAAHVSPNDPNRSVQLLR